MYVHHSLPVEIREQIACSQLVVAMATLNSSSLLPKTDGVVEKSLGWTKGKQIKNIEIGSWRGGDETKEEQKGSLRTETMEEKKDGGKHDGKIMNEG